MKEQEQFKNLPESIEQKQSRLLALIEEEKWPTNSEIREEISSLKEGKKSAHKAIFQFSREEDMLDREVDGFNLMKQCVRENNFYEAQIPISEVHKISAHQFLFDTLPSRPKDYRDEYPEKARRKVEILKLMEEIDPPTVRHILFGKGDLITETPPESFRLTDSEDIKAIIRIWRPDKKEVWVKSGRYWAGHPDHNDLENTYHMSVSLTDRNDQIIKDFGKDLPEGGAIVLGSAWAADPYHNVAVFLDRMREDEFNRLAIMNLRHEIGHVEQFRNSDFRRGFKEKTGKEIEDFPSSHFLLEEDAWKRAITSLKDAEQKTGKKILPEDWELVIKQNLKDYKEKGTIDFLLG